MNAQELSGSRVILHSTVHCPLRLNPTLHSKHYGSQRGKLGHTSFPRALCPITLSIPVGEEIMIGHFSGSHRRLWPPLALARQQHDVGLGWSPHGPASAGVRQHGTLGRGAQQSVRPARVPLGTARSRCREMRAPHHLKVCKRGGMIGRLSRREALKEGSCAAASVSTCTHPEACD